MRSWKLLSIWILAGCQLGHSKVEKPDVHLMYDSSGVASSKYTILLDTEGNVDRYDEVWGSEVKNGHLSRGGGMQRLFTEMDLSSSIENENVALDRINEIIFNNGPTAKLVFRKAEVLWQRRDTLVALENFTEAYALDSGNAQSAINIVEILLSIGDIDQAAQWVERISKSSNHPETQHLLAGFYDQSEQKAKARAIWTKLSRNGDTKASKILMEHASSQGSYDSLLVYANYLLAVDSSNLEALCAKGYAFGEKGYFQSSIRYYKKVLSRDSSYQDAIDGMDKVNRKIAYLRRIKEKKESISGMQLLVPEKKKVIAQ